MIRLLKRRTRTSWSDRKFYSKRLEKSLTNPALQDLKNAYLFTSTEASERNFDDILKFIAGRHYFRLSAMRHRIHYSQDDLGLYVSANLYYVYLLIDHKAKFYFAVIFEDELKALINVESFLYKFYLKRLVYPVDK